MDSMENDQDDDLCNLFISEEYVEDVFRFNDVEQRLLCGKMSTTAYDLTGQIVWPASRILAWYISLHRQHFRDKNIVELGAGCGLGGFVASQFAQNVNITDGNDVVLRLLQRNQEHLGLTNTKTNKLLWGVRSEIDRVYPDGSFPNCIVGADIILWPNVLRSLLSTIRWLMLLSHTASSDEDGSSLLCVVSYVHRANSTWALLLELVAEMGLELEVVPAETFVPIEETSLRAVDARILLLSLRKETLLQRDALLEREEAVEQQLTTSALPC
eukprot:gene35038-42435_t